MLLGTLNKDAFTRGTLYNTTIPAGIVTFRKAFPQGFPTGFREWCVANFHVDTVTDSWKSSTKNGVLVKAAKSEEELRKMKNGKELHLKANLMSKEVQKMNGLWIDGELPFGYQKSCVLLAIREYLMLQNSQEKAMQSIINSLKTEKKKTYTNKEVEADFKEEYHKKIASIHKMKKISSFCPPTWLVWTLCGPPCEKPMLSVCTKEVSTVLNFSFLKNI